MLASAAGVDSGASRTAKGNASSGVLAGTDRDKGETTSKSGRWGEVLHLWRGRNCSSSSPTESSGDASLRDPEGADQGTISLSSSSLLRRGFLPRPDTWPTEEGYLRTVSLEAPWSINLRGNRDKESRWDWRKFLPSFLFPPSLPEHGWTCTKNLKVRFYEAKKNSSFYPDSYSNHGQ